MKKDIKKKLIICKEGMQNAIARLTLEYNKEVSKRRDMIDAIDEMLGLQSSNKSDVTTLTVEDCLKGAFQALLRGDTHERDKLCAMAERAFKDDVTPIAGDTPVPMGKMGTQ